MIEEIYKGAAIGVQRLDQADELGNTWRLIVIDGQVVDGNLVPGSGTGKVVSVFLDDVAAAAVRDGFSDAHGVAVAKPRLVVPRGKL